MSVPTLDEILKGLPEDICEELRSLAQAKRGLFGRRQTQEIVATYLHVIQRLREDFSATHLDLATIIAACGITARDGRPLSAGTISSAISRAMSLSKPTGHSGKRRTSGPRRSVRTQSPKRPAVVTPNVDQLSSESGAAGPAAARRYDADGTATGTPVTTPRAPSRDPPQLGIHLADRHEILLTLLHKEE